MRYIVHWKNGKTSECYGATIFDAVGRYLGMGSGAFENIEYAEEHGDIPSGAKQELHGTTK